MPKKAPLKRIGRPPVDTIAEGERRAAIVRIATTLFGQRGYAAVPLAEIAGLVGVTKAALYHHFPSKDDLYTEVMCDLLQRISAGIRQINSLDLPIAEKMRQLIETALHNMRQSTSMDTMMRDVREHLTPEQQARIAAAHREMDEALATVMRAGISSGQLRDRDPHLLARAFRHLLAGFSDDDYLRTDPNAVQVIIDLFLHGILSDLAPNSS
jgi:AcrR family transcriptional regulator